MTHTETHRFKRGQRLQLDEIYSYSGVGDDVVGTWWDPDDEVGEDITITQDIEITIKIRTPNSPLGQKRST